ncbi:DUF1349 domain-containing protein [Rhodopirellula baltica]
MSCERLRCEIFVVTWIALGGGGIGSQLVADEPKRPLDAEEPEVLFVDEFDVQLSEQWNPVRPDPERFSLNRHPGKLTLVTHHGDIVGDVRKRRAPLAKNLFLIPNPAEGDGDFVVTTCVESFRPTMKYQQAGLLIYDGDDNYLKFDLESNGSTPGFKHIREQDAFRLYDTDPKIKPADRVWFRLVKRGNVYERAYSTDGKKFEVFGEAVWGDGSPLQVGIIAFNGPREADEIEASFDFFRVRKLTREERDDPAYLQRQKIAGSWDVVKTRASGEDLVEGPISEFRFDGGDVSFVIQGERTEVDFMLDIESEPNGFTMSSLTVGATDPVHGNYELNEDQLVLCLSLPPGTPAPQELGSSPGDGRILMTLKRSN